MYISSYNVKLMLLYVIPGKKSSECIERIGEVAGTG